MVGGWNGKESLVSVEVFYFKQGLLTNTTDANKIDETILQRRNRPTSIAL